MMRRAEHALQSVSVNFGSVTRGQQLWIRLAPNQSSANLFLQ
jgi:hypothetical protein